MHAGVACASAGDVKPVTPPLHAGAAGDGGDDDDSHGRGKRKRKTVDISDMIDEDNLVALDSEWQETDGERAGVAVAASAGPPYKMAKNGVLMRRCALCRCASLCYAAEITSEVVLSVS